MATSDCLYDIVIESLLIQLFCDSFRNKASLHGDAELLILLLFCLEFGTIFINTVDEVTRNTGSNT